MSAAHPEGPGPGHLSASAAVPGRAVQHLFTGSEVIWSLETLGGCRPQTQLPQAPLQLSITGLMGTLGS